MCIITGCVVLAVIVWHTCSVEDYLLLMYTVQIESVLRASIKIQSLQLTIHTSISTKNRNHCKLISQRNDKFKSSVHFVVKAVSVVRCSNMHLIKIKQSKSMPGAIYAQKMRRVITK